MALIDDVKDAVRVSDNDSDTEIKDLINSAKADLGLSGVHKNKVKEDDPLIKRAIILYCKANYGYDPQTERYQDMYTSLKHHLTLSTEYTEDTEVVV